MAALLERLKEASPDQPWSGLANDARARLDRLADASPLYAQLLTCHPAWALWLEEPRNLHEEFRFQALLDEWRSFRSSHAVTDRESPAYVGTLRRFRRRMSLRIAYREVNELASGAVTVGELTRLAEFCLRECWFAAQQRWTRRLGEPWDDARDCPARFCVLGLGKLGGGELNFSSDVDLIYLYEGDGATRRDGRATATTSGEWFHRIGETITELLNQSDADGFLFRADLRLRPGGAAGPLVPAFAAVENYYAATTQTWERLALLKARPVAGDLALGAELLENLHSFRYPRHPPPALLAEVAEMKLRTEREVVGTAALERDVKSGFGGIREIEFIAQVLQLLHAGSFPFLQTHSTTEALRQLARYELIGAGDAGVLEDAYWFLRKVEHRVQIAEERQTHELPEEPEVRERLARSLGFAGATAFEAHLATVRAVVHAHYGHLFGRSDTAVVQANDPWWTFFADGRAAPAVAERLKAWFHTGLEDAEAAKRVLRLFVRGSDTQPLLRDQVQRFAALVPALDRVAPRLARPRATLQRISTFGERYGSRSQFLAACTLNPQFFEVLALLFDRSRFIHELLSRHPEIFDEVLRPEILRKRKDARARQRELSAHPGSPPAGFAAWLWLYVRAEQVRAAIGQLLGFLDDEAIEAELTALADAVLTDLLARVPGGDRLLVVALGKLGGRELSFGSDLDLIFVGSRAADDRADATVRSVQRTLAATTGRDATFAVDLRLRPHGEAGPLVTTMDGVRDYFARSAQAWERQVLTRSRVVTGPAELADAWREFLAATNFSAPLSREAAADLWQMRLRVQQERDVVTPPERAFKTGRGGLIDIEFALQILQLRHGSAHPAVLDSHTRTGWQALAERGLVAPAEVGRICENLRHLKQIEWALRRDLNRAVSVIPSTPKEQQALACWLGAPSWEVFWNQHTARMHETRDMVRSVLQNIVPSTALETDR